MESLLLLALVLSLSYAFWLKLSYVRLKKKAKAGAELGKHAFENTALGMAVVAPDLRYIEINSSYCDIVGYTKEELMKMTHKDFTYPEDRENDTPYVLDLLQGKMDTFSSIKRYIHKEGYIVWGKATVSVVRDEDGHPKFFVTQIQDITANKKAEEALQEAKVKAELSASTDYLTGCLNRGAFVNRLEEELARAKRNQRSISLILVDIDDFKAVNDFYGHLAGDSVLQKFSECLVQAIRAYDFLGRFGGEEFVIALPDTEVQDAYLIAERMRKSVENLMVHYDGSRIKITGSFGVAFSLPEAEEQVDQLIARADQAMYAAKALKNRVEKSA